MEQQPNDVTGTIGYLSGAVKFAKESGLALNEFYAQPNESEDGRVQQEIRLGTRSLNNYFCGMSFWNASNVQQGDLENALEMLEDAIVLFGNHPFKNVLYGRQVFIATESSKAGLKVPIRFASRVNAKLETWQKPSWNYATPADFKSTPKKIEGLPPEWRNWSPN